MSTPWLNLDALAIMPMPSTGCFNCRHLVRETESWEMEHVFWYECGKRPQNSNLRNFPFRLTSCAVREPRS